MPGHQPDSLGYDAATPRIGMRPVADLAALRIAIEPIQADRSQAPVIPRISYAPGNAGPASGQLADGLEVAECVVTLVRPRHRDEPISRARVRAGFDDAVDIGAAEGSQPNARAVYLDRVQPRLRHPWIVSDQGGDPTVLQFASLHQQAPDSAIEDEADIRRDTPRRPVANHRAPPNEPEPGDLESVVTDQPQRRSHDGAASRLRVQAKADLGNPVAFEVEIDAATAATPAVSPRLNGPAESLTTGPTGGSQRKKLLGVSQLVAIRWSRHRRPADHLRIAALLDYRAEIAPVRRPERDVGLGIDENRDRVGEGARCGQRRKSRVRHEPIQSSDAAA